MLIRAPVPWHNQYCLSSQYIEKHYYNGNIVVRKIRDLWFEKYTDIHYFSILLCLKIIFCRYDDMLILPVPRLQEKKIFPLECTEFEEQLTYLCEESRTILMKFWLPSYADIFLNYKEYWKQYIPRNFSDSTQIIESFFNCVNMLLSLQLRWLVMKSLKHVVDYMLKYKVSLLCL